ncbi:helix-hairpin-helix domain-containing protein [Caldalkalibacillus mannanilyticus]|uniref:helix-hairpin-helix domain-containing protein n=1 Tax=Caldalkalibacillus mannanilyticus TaxID=1418 RepID=UPI00046A7394|nr:helix-hairpin-helix domain-containing protein [Caldalkalibacillus mannanilyticus]
MKQWTTRERKNILLIIIGILIAGSVAYSLLKTDEEEKSYITDGENQDFSFERKENSMIDSQVVVSTPLEEDHEERIMVDIKGEVKKPGVYELLAGDRVIDALEKAGGTTEAGTTEYLNLAQKLSDGMVVYVPTQEELAEGKVPLGSNGSNLNPSSSTSGKISLNQGTAKELESLPGIGPSKAQAIIQYREQNGPFKKVEDLLNISGIGPKVFERVKDLVEL